MDYYDGNTVTGLWNYAQHFAMSDNSYSDTFGPSTPGAINVTARQHVRSDLRPDAARSTTRRRARAARAARPADRPRPRRSRRARARLQRRRSQLRHLLDDPGRKQTRASTDPDGRQEHRRPAEQRRDHLGLVPGRLREPGLRVRATRARDDLSAVCTGHASTTSAGASRHGLQPPPRAVPVLRVDGQPAAPAADVDRDDRPPGSGQPPVRPEGLLGGRRRRQPAGGVVSEGRGVPGRSRRLLGSARRADVPGRDDQPARAAPELEEHRGRDRLRRQRRLVRPPDGTDHQPVADARSTR